MCHNQFNTQDRAFLMLSGQNNRHLSYNLPQSTCGCNQNTTNSSVILQVPVLYGSTGSCCTNNNTYIIQGGCQQDNRRYEVDMMCSGIRDIGFAIGDIIRASRAGKSSYSCSCSQSHSQYSELENLKKQIEELKKQIEENKCNCKNTPKVDPKKDEPKVDPKKDDPKTTPKSKTNTNNLSIITARTNALNRAQTHSSAQHPTSQRTALEAFNLWGETILNELDKENPNKATNSHIKEFTYKVELFLKQNPETPYTKEAREQAKALLDQLQAKQESKLTKKTSEKTNTNEATSTQASTTNSNETTTATKTDTQIKTQFEKACNKKELEEINKQTKTICADLKIAIAAGDVDKANEIAKGLSEILVKTSEYYSTISSYIKDVNISTEEIELGRKTIEYIEEIQEQMFEVLSLDIETNQTNDSDSSNTTVANNTSDVTTIITSEHKSSRKTSIDVSLSSLSDL